MYIHVHINHDTVPGSVPVSPLCSTILDIKLVHIMLETWMIAVIVVGSIVFTLGIFLVNTSWLWCSCCKTTSSATVQHLTPPGNKPVFVRTYPVGKATNSHDHLKIHEACTTMPSTTQGNKIPVSSIPSEQNAAYGAPAALAQGNKVPANSIPSERAATYHVHGAYGWTNTASEEHIYTECY